MALRTNRSGKFGHRDRQKGSQGRRQLRDSVMNKLIQMLHEYVEIFSWSYEDMPGLDTDIVVHCLPTKEGCPPVK